MESFSVFTILSGQVVPGATVETLHLKGAGIDILAVIVGEEGRGRERGVIPVAPPLPPVPCPFRDRRVRDREPTCGLCGSVLGHWEDSGRMHPDEGDHAPSVPCPFRGRRVHRQEPTCELCKLALGPWFQGGRSHPSQGEVRNRLMFAEVGQTKAGKPKFLPRSEATTTDEVIIVFRTKIGFRGGNWHSGDRRGWRCNHYGCTASGEGQVVPETCPGCGKGGDDLYGPRPLFSDFPGRILTRGWIAQGGAGRAGGGEQLIAILPRDTVFRTEYSGRLYGAPASHYYKWDGERLLSATWEERVVSDLF